MCEKATALSSIRMLSSSPTTPERMEEAIGQCIRMSVDFPDDAEVFFVLGDLYLKTKALSLACNALLRSAQLEPNNVFTRLLLLRCYSEMGQWRNALPHAHTALALQSSEGHLKVDVHNLEAVSLLGKEALFNRDFETAAKYFEMVIAVLEKRISTKNLPIPSFDFRALPPLSQRRVHPILYLPVEVKAREFESKALLALAAVNLGVHVVIGRSWVMSVGEYEDLPPGLVLFKTLNAMDANNMAIAKARGRHIVVALDEEAFGRSASVRALRLNVDPLAVATADLILMQGNRHYEVWKDYFSIEANKLVVTGNPKLDLFSSQSHNQISAERKRPKILFCTMSGNVNPQGRSFARTMEQTLAAGAVGASPEMVSELAQLMTDSTRFELALIPQLIESIETIAQAFPIADIIVRPHPIEDSSFWVDRFPRTSNISVETEGALTEWLDRCDVLIHIAGCGSGVEAALHGIPAVRFVGDGTASDPDVGLSSEINIAAQKPDEVLATLKNILQADQGKQEKKPEANLSEYLHQPEDSSVADQVAQALKKFCTAHENDDKVPLDKLKKLADRRAIHYDLKPFHLQKFPDTRASEVFKLLQNLCQRFDYSDIPTVDEIEDGLFLLSPPTVPS